MRLIHCIFLLIVCCFFSIPIEGAPPTKIAIVTVKNPAHTPWDPESVRKGITGSEEAVIFMSQRLARLGYQVSVYGDPPPGSPHSLPEANPRFLDLNQFDGKTNFDIAIAWRFPQLGPILKNYARKVYLWPHDECGFPGLTQELIQSFDDVLWLSKWQRMHWASGYPTFAKYTKTFGNGVNLEQFQSLKPRSNPYSCIYGSNYARGLEVLLDCWPQVKKRFPKATLDIYYGWQHWQQMTPEKEQKLRTQVAQLKTLDVQEHGLVSHEELNRAYEKASFWTYPCTMIEVFCITALRAQLAGAIPVIIEGSALPETVRHGYKCSKPEEYAATLIRAMEDAEKISLQDRKPLGDFIRKEYTWEKIARDWKELFDADLSQPPSLSFKSLETASKAS